MGNRLLKKYHAMPIAAKAAFWFMVCSFLQKAISILTTPIFTRLMSTEQYGQFTVYTSWMNILLVITTLRLNYSVFNKGMSKYKEDRDVYTCTMQYITTILAFALLIVYLLFHGPINSITELPTFIMLGMIAELISSPAISFWTLKKRYEYHYRDVVIRTFSMAFLNAALGVLAVTLAVEKGYARIQSVILVNLCFGIPIYLYNLKKGHFKFNIEYAKFALLFNLPLLLHFLSIYILDHFDKIMIQKMVGFGAAALYGLTYHVGTLMKIFTSSLNSAIVPWMYGELEHKSFRKVDNVVFATTGLVALISLGLSVIAPEAIYLFAGPKYHEAIYVVPPIAVGMIFQFIYTMYANVEFYFDLNKAAMYISGVAALLNLVLNFIGIKLFGYVAAAYTTAICYLLMSVGHYLYMVFGVKRATGAEPSFNAFRMFTVYGFVAGICILISLLYPYPVIRYSLLALGIVIVWINREYILSQIAVIRKSSKR